MTLVNQQIEGALQQVVDENSATEIGIFADPAEATKYAQVSMGGGVLICEVSDSGEIGGEALSDDQRSALAALGFEKDFPNYRIEVAIVQAGSDAAVHPQLTAMTVNEVAEALGRGLTEVHGVAPDTVLEISLM